MESLSYQELDHLIGFVPSGLTDAHFQQDLAALSCLGCRLRSRVVELRAELWRKGLPCPVKLGVREMLAERCRVLGPTAPSR
jgi:hypothetical protein